MKAVSTLDKASHFADASSPSEKRLRFWRAGLIGSLGLAMTTISMAFISAIDAIFNSTEMMSSASTRTVLILASIAFLMAMAHCMDKITERKA